MDTANTNRVECTCCQRDYGLCLACQRAEIPESIEEELTVPVAAVPMAELVKQPRYPARGWDGDHNNGVDDRAGKWGRSW